LCATLLLACLTPMPAQEVVTRQPHQAVLAEVAARLKSEARKRAMGPS
jgi:hypothetical protein